MNTEQNTPGVPAMPVSEILAQLRARRPTALRLLGAIFISSLIISAILQPRFYATATVAVLPSPEFTVRQDAGSRVINTSALALDQIMKAECEILQSADVHESTLKMVGMLKVYPNIGPNAGGTVARIIRTTISFLMSPWIVTPLDSYSTEMERALVQFDSDLLILPTKETNVISITFRHRDRALAAQVVNAMLLQYARRREQLYNDPQLNVVQHVADALNDSVKKTDAALATFEVQHGISDYDSERALLVRRESGASQALADAEAAEAEDKARVAVLNKQIESAPTAVALYSENDTDTRLQAIDTSLVDLRAQLAATRVRYRETSHKVMDLITQMNTRVADRLRLSRNAAPSVVRGGRSPALDGLLLDRAIAQSECAGVHARANSLHDELRGLARRLAALTIQETSFADLQRRKAAAGLAFSAASQVLAEQRMTEAEDALRLANVRVIEHARAPLHTEPIALLVIFAGAMFGVLAALLWCIAKSLHRPTLMTPEGLAHATGLPVLGIFPTWPEQQPIYLPG